MSPEYTPESLLAMGRGFMESRILLTGAELDLFTMLAPAPLLAQDLAERTGFHLRPLTVLLDALTAMGLLIKKDARYQTEPSVAPFLSSDAPGSVLPMVLHGAGLWKTWSQLTTIVSEAVGPERPAAAFRSQDDLKAFIGAMAAVGAPMARSIAAAADPGRAKYLLDVGGATGTYTLAFLEANPDLKATIFDLPPVIEMARERLVQTGVMDRITLVAGNFYEDDLPAGHDLALLSAIIHQNSIEQNLALYCKVFAALDPGGRIIIRDHVMDPERTGPPAGAIFAVNMLVNTTGGGTYTFDEIKTGLTEAGFERVSLINKGGRMDSLVEAYKP